jgi:membrane protein DedA with SNARE-associated domain
MSGLTDRLLELALEYGYPLITLIAFVGTLGLPIPTEPVLMAAGALAATGDLSLPLLLVLVTLASVAGDTVGYLVGRWLGYAVLVRRGGLYGLTERRLATARAFLHRWAAMGVFLTRWLLTPLGLPVNLLAGASGYSVAAFMGITAVGAAIRAGLYLGLGYWFGASWTAIFDEVQDLPLFLAGLFVGVASLALGIRLWRRRHPRPRARPIASTAAQPAPTVRSADLTQ